jgi:hypothetical protein
LGAWEIQRNSGKEGTADNQRFVGDFWFLVIPLVDFGKKLRRNFGQIESLC